MDTSRSYKIIPRKGYDALWDWFELSHASWLTLQRVLMHEMPDEWQLKLAKLLHEWDATIVTDTLDVKTIVQLKTFDGKFIKVPEWLKNYRHPDSNIKQYVKKHI